MADSDDDIQFQSFDNYFVGLPAAGPITGTEPMIVYQGGTTKQTPASSVGGGGSGSLTIGTTTVSGGTDNNALTVGGGKLGETPIRTILTADTNYYVATTGSDSNPGTLAQPWATLQHAVNIISGTIDIAGFNVFVNIGAGTFNGCRILSTVGGGFWQFSGAGSASTTINEFVANQIVVAVPEVNESVIGFNACTFQAQTTDSFMFGIFAPCQFILGNINSFTADVIIDESLAAGFVVFAEGPNVNFLIPNSPITIKCNNQTSLSGHFFDISFNAIVQDSADWTLTGTGNSWQVFCNVFTGGGYRYQSGTGFTDNTIGGTKNTIRFEVFDNGFIGGFGGSFAPLTFFPGDTAGHCFGTAASLNDSPLFFSKSGPPAIGDVGLADSGNISGSWTIFKDTSNGPRTLVINDGGVLYCTQIVRTPNTQTSNYILALSDQDGRVEMNLAGANTLTVPANATVAFPIGTEIRITQIGAGATTVTAAVGVTGRNFGALSGQWASVMLYKRGTNEWVQTNV